MWIKKEINSIADFEAWSGGKATLDAVIKLDKCNELDSLINDAFCNSEDSDAINETALNDFLWFENDMIAEYLGVSINKLYGYEDE